MEQPACHGRVTLSGSRPREDVALAVVFGSFAKGTSREASDLDLAILPTGAFSLEDEAQLVDAVERATNREVDLVRLDRTEDIVLRREIGLYGVAVYMVVTRTRSTTRFNRVPPGPKRLRASTLTAPCGAPSASRASGARPSPSQEPPPSPTRPSPRPTPPPPQPPPRR